MNNCLVTKLKGSTGDSSLPLFGALELIIKSTDGYFTFSGPGCIFKLYDSSGNLVETQEEGISKPSGTGYNGKIVIENKYGLTVSICSNLESNTVKIEDIEFCTELTNITMRLKGNMSKLASFTKLSNFALLAPLNGEEGMVGDISVVSNFSSNLNYFYIGQMEGVYGDISIFQNLFLGLTSLTIMSSNVHGNIVNFGKHTSLSELWLNLSGVSGEITDLADSQVANGRITGTLDIPGNGLITTNGAPYWGTKRITFSNGSYVISDVL